MRLDISTNTKDYSEYPEISYWYDARKLYAQLEIVKILGIALMYC